MWAGASARATHDTGCWTEVWGVKSRTVLNDVTRKFWILHATSGGAVRAFSVRKLCRYSAIHRYRQCAQICRKYYSRVSGTYSSSYSTRELQLLDPGVMDCGSSGTSDVPGGREPTRMLFRRHIVIANPALDVQVYRATHNARSHLAFKPVQLWSPCTCT